MSWRRRRRRRPGRRPEKYGRSERASLAGSWSLGIGPTKHIPTSPKEIRERTNNPSVPSLSVWPFPVKGKCLVDPRGHAIEHRVPSGFESCLTSVIEDILSEAIKEREQELEVLDWNGRLVRKKRIINVF